MDMLNMLMASGWTIWHDFIKIPLLIVMAICAIFIILVVIFQPGNSSGISALGGQTETFLSKNKGKTFEHKMRKLTVISSIVFAVLCIAFAIVAKLASLA
jgi:preprotein translocase subunit SecG